MDSGYGFSGSPLARARRLGAENLGLMRRIALPLLQHERNRKVGVQLKRLKADWDKEYLLKILIGRVTKLSWRLP